MSASNTDTTLPVAVIGAGPVGLAAAAHLAERGLDFVVLEAGPQAAASVARWGHVRVFSPWRYDIDTAARRLLDAAGWTAPDPELLPTGAELVDSYLQPLAKLPAIAPTCATTPGSSRSAGSASTGSAPEAGRRPRL